MAEEQRLYQTIEPVSEADAKASIGRNNPDELRLVVVGVGLYSEDLEWSEQFCLRLTQHEHYNVRGNAILSLGHLARRFRRLENDGSIKAVRHALADAHDYIRAQAEDAADDIEWYAKLPVRIPGNSI